MGFLARMGGPGVDGILKLKGDVVVVAPDAGEGAYGGVPEEAERVAIVMSDGPAALHLAASAIEDRPGTQVHVLYLEMQVAAPGMQELQLELAGRGVGFHRYEARSLRVEGGRDGGWTLSFIDPLLPGTDPVVLEVDHVAMPAPREVTDLVWPWFLSRYAPVGVPAGRRLSVLPVLTPRRGVYTTLPANATTTAAALGGTAAVAMALSDYARGFPPMDQVAVVDPEKCAACLNCLRLCPHDAIAFDDETRAAVVMVRACQSCGMCCGICPGEAIEMVPRDELEVD